MAKLKRKFYRQSFTVTVLSDEPLPSTMGLSQVQHAITDGECSGQVERGPVEILSGKQMAKALEDQGSDPVFFGLERDGTDL